MGRKRDIKNLHRKPPSNAADGDWEDWEDQLTQMTRRRHTHNERHKPGRKA
ncbi:MAG: hypothetical protein ACON34_00795 [Flavobacteriales bacterium]